MERYCDSDRKSKVVWRRARESTSRSVDSLLRVGWLHADVHTTDVRRSWSSWNKPLLCTVLRHVRSVGWRWAGSQLRPCRVYPVYRSSSAESFDTFLENVAILVDFWHRIKIPPISSAICVSHPCLIAFSIIDWHDSEVMMMAPFSVKIAIRSSSISIAIFSLNAEQFGFPDC